MHVKSKGKGAEERKEIGTTGVYIYNVRGSNDVYYSQEDRSKDTFDEYTHHYKTRYKNRERNVQPIPGYQ